MYQPTVEQCNSYIQNWIKAHKAYFSDLSSEESRSDTIQRAYQAWANKDWDFFFDLIEETAKMREEVSDLRSKIFRDILAIYDKYKGDMSAPSRASLLRIAEEALDAPDMKASYRAHWKASEVIKADFSNKTAEIVLSRYRLKEKA